MQLIACSDETRGHVALPYSIANLKFCLSPSFRRFNRRRKPKWGTPARQGEHLSAQKTVGRSRDTKINENNMLEARLPFRRFDPSRPSQGYDFCATRSLDDTNTPVADAAECSFFAVFHPIALANDPTQDRAQLAMLCRIDFSAIGAGRKNDPLIWELALGRNAA
jgi:hypothetical protein